MNFYLEIIPYYRARQMGFKKITGGSTILGGNNKLELALGQKFIQQCQEPPSPEKVVVKVHRGGLWGWL